MTPKEVRNAHRIPLIRIAAAALVAEATVRVYEADREAVSPPKREALDPSSGSFENWGAAEKSTSLGDTPDDGCDA